MTGVDLGLAVFLTTVSAILIFVLVELAEWERPLSWTAFMRSVGNKVAAAHGVTLGVLPLVHWDNAALRALTFGVLGRGAFADFAPGWYQACGSVLALQVILYAVTSVVWCPICEGLRALRERRNNRAFTTQVSKDTSE